MKKGNNQSALYQDCYEKYACKSIRQMAPDMKTFAATLHRPPLTLLENAVFCKIDRQRPTLKSVIPSPLCVVAFTVNGFHDE